jgi:hypothetical protein
MTPRSSESAKYALAQNDDCTFGWSGTHPANNVSDSGCVTATPPSGHPTSVLDFACFVYSERLLKTIPKPYRVTFLIH